MKWYYYAHAESDYVWKQNESLKGNPSHTYELYILDKQEAVTLAKNWGVKIDKVIINLKPSKMAKDKKSKKKGKEKNEKKEKKSSPKKNNNAKKEGNSNAQVVRKLDGSLALSKLKHAILTKKNKKGKKIKCIVIPIKENYLFESKEGAVYLNVRVNLKDDEDQFNQHGFIGQQVPSDIYKAASDEEKEEMKKTPILGGLKDWEFSSTSNDTAGSAGEMDEDDDLPF